jgi:hypothetical protein
MTTQKTFKRRVLESYTAARAQLLPEPTKEQAATGRTYAQWFALLDRAGAAEMTHRDIARLLRDEHDVPPWWSQNVTVEYERARGRRAVNQNDSGFYAGVSKTIRRPAAEVYAAIEARLDGWEVSRRPSRARFVVRADAAVGRPVITVDDKGDRCTVVVQHERLPDADAVAEWKGVWRERLAALTVELSA